MEPPQRYFKKPLEACENHSDTVKLTKEGRCRICCNDCEQIEYRLLDDSDGRSYYKHIKKHLIDAHGYGASKSHSGNGTHVGAFAFTLTKSPTDDLSEEDMCNAVRKIMGQQSCPVEKYAWYLEHKDDGAHPHIHGMYKTITGGKIEAKHFKRAWKIWDPSIRMGAGFRGGYHRPVRSDEKYSQYIAKDGGIGDSSE